MALPADIPSNAITINRISFGDLAEVLTAGWRDFLRAPAFGLFFASVYALGGLALFAAVFQFDMAWLAYPLVIGFALIGPFIASGLYEVSRRLEAGLPLTWSAVLGVVLNQHRREFGWMAFVILFIFWVWMYQIRTLVAVFFGFEGFSTFSGFVEAVLTTPNGWTFLAAGHAVGAAISLVLFALTVVSCPMLLERDVDFVTAMLTSIRTIALSPLPLLLWGCFVVVSMLLAAGTAFAGLLIVLPVLGHATWHLYRRAISGGGGLTGK
ncbi:MAG: DUF2189 domain-containing protein [Pseudomonadota bacterium]